MNRKVISYKAVLLLFLFLCLSLPAFAKGPEKDTAKKFYKTNALDPQRTLSNINNWAYWLYADGQSGITVTGQSGGNYPRGTDNVIFQDGFMWGAKVKGNIRVGGQNYSIGTVSQLNDRVYRIRSDWAILSKDLIKEDIAEFFEIATESVTQAQADQVIEQYREDWKNWPVEFGAPYIDVDGNGIYNPVLDENGMADPNLGDYPGIASADQVVFLSVDDSDNSVATSLHGSDGIGITLQITTWGYNQRNATLGQMMFKKYKIINTSSDTFEEMYVAQWCDPDVGNSSDDLVGCDEELSLGFAYNGGPNDDNYDDFGIAPPAFGYDFFQGPIVAGAPTDTAVFDLKKRPGFKNLPLTSFAYFSAGNSEWSDPVQNDYDGTLEWYNLLRGNISKTNTDNPISFTHRATGEETNFPLNGDPVTGVGDVDGTGANFPNGDRRMSVNTGPFTMAPGDTQEVVVAIVGGSGSTYLQSITQMKNNDALAQKLYNDLFATIPKAPPSPEIVATPFENKIVLNWGGDAEAVARTEETRYPDSDTTSYDFEGYNVWQLSFGLNPQKKLIATYDKINGVTTIEQEVFINDFGSTEIVPVQNGSDSGLKRFFVVQKDYITNLNLVPGNIYYFAVTAYNYNGTPQLITDKSLESSIVSVQVQTQSVPAGKKISSSAGDLLTATHMSGGSDGSAEIVVVDPTSTNGHDYEIVFHVDEDTTSATHGQTVWDLKDVTDGGAIIVANQPQYEPGGTPRETPIVDGIQASVFGPPLVCKDWGWEDVGIVSPLYPDYADGRCISGNSGAGGQENVFFGGLAMGYIFWNGPGSPSLIAPADYREIEFRFTHMTAYDDTSGDGAYTFGADGGEPYSFNLDEGQKAFAYSTWGYGNYLGTIDIPFTVWDVDDPDNPRQLNVIIRDRDQNGQWDLGTGNGPYNYVFVMNDTYDPTAWDASTPEKDFMGVGPDVAMYTGWFVQRGTRPFLARDGVLTLTPNRVNTVDDMFAFTTPEVEQSISLEKEAAKKVNVFPNPYYAGNEQETTILGKFVTFSHLSNKAEIRIFNLSGDHIVKLTKDDASPFLRWDLRNKDQLPVASGIYFAQVKLTLSDGSKVTRNLKVFIIQRQQQLKYF